MHSCIIFQVQVGELNPDNGTNLVLNKKKLKKHLILECGAECGTISPQSLISTQGPTCITTRVIWKTGSVCQKMMITRIINC